MPTLHSENNSVTRKFSKQAEEALSDDRYHATGFAFDLTHMPVNAQIRYFNTFAAYAAIMSNYLKEDFVQPYLKDIAVVCNELVSLIGSHKNGSAQPMWEQPTLL